MSRARWVLAAGAGVCLVLAALFAPPPAARHDGVLAALGRSMGGARVLVIDVLFLRAEAERKAGRIDEAAALYDTVLELDPANEAASMFLANVYVDELMPQVSDLEARFRWWLEARALTERSLARHPDSPALHTHAGLLILAAPQRDPAFAGLLERELGRPRLVAMRHLLRAVRAVETLPRTGRVHLTSMSVLPPLVAAEALRDGDGTVAREALAAGRETLARRGDILAQMPIEAGSDLHLRFVLDLGLEAVQAVAEARRPGGKAEKARELLAAYRDLLSGSDLPGILEEALAR